MREKVILGKFRRDSYLPFGTKNCKDANKYKEGSCLWGQIVLVGLSIGITILYFGNILFIFMECRKKCYIRFLTTRIYVLSSLRELSN